MSEEERHLKRALRRVGWRAFWWTFLHPWAWGSEDRDRHRSEVLRDFRREIGSDLL